jgi:hypothetical protein
VTTQNQEIPSPETESTTQILPASAVDAPAAQEPRADTTPAPKLSADDARIAAIEGEIALLEKYAAEAETGRQRREFLTKRDALSHERSMLQIKPVLEAPERESEPAPDAPALNETRDGYQIDVPTGALASSLHPLAQEYAEDFGKIALELSIPADEANALFEYVAVHATAQLDGLNTANEREVMTYLHREYGQTAADAMVTAAQKAFATLPKSVQAWLSEPDYADRRLTNSPSVISLLALYGSGYSRLSPEAAAKELTTLRASKGYLSGDALTRDKAHLLQILAGRRAAKDTAATAAPKAKAVPTAAKSKLETEAREIRKDAGYWSKDAPNHKALQSRMAQIMGELYPEGN